MQKKVPYVAQLGNMDCSIACMTMLFRYYGLDVDIVDVGQVVHIGRDGVNLTQLKQATQQFGFKCTAYRYNKQKNILDSNLPAVVYSGSHLAVIGSKTVLGQYILLVQIMADMERMIGKGMQLIYWNSFLFACSVSRRCFPRHAAYSCGFLIALKYPDLTPKMYPKIVYFLLKMYPKGIFA